MPITINGTTDSRVGYVAPTLGEFAADCDGTHVAPPNRTGFVAPAVGSFTTDLQGQFGATANFDGDMNFTLGGFDVEIISSQIDNWDWDAPSLQDERDFYTNVMGWNYPSGYDPEDFNDTGAQGTYSWASPASFGLGNIHNDTEGDDLWLWDQQNKRYATTQTQQFRDNALTVYKNSIVTNLDSNDPGFFYDHMYGQGLATIYNDTSDATILTVLNAFKSRLQSQTHMISAIAGTPVPTSEFWARGFGRWAITCAYAYQAAPDADWLEMRDACVFAYSTSIDWEEGGVMGNGVGNFFGSEVQQDVYASETSGGAWPYSTYRTQSTFSWAVQNEAMWRLYVQTGDATLRDRLIKSARYILKYMWEPSWVYPNCGSHFGHNINDGTRADIDGGDSGTFANAFTDCSYDMSCVNTLVIGYKLTGETIFLDRAREAFARGNRWDPGGSYTVWTEGSAVNEMHKFLDTTPDNSTVRFQFNKGTLQYAYQVLENGGAPSVNPGVDVVPNGPVAQKAATMSSGTWEQLTTTTGLETIASNYLAGSYGTQQGARGFFEYATGGVWIDDYNELHFRGSGHQSAGIQVRYSESTGTWTMLNSFPAWEHQYDHTAYDQANNVMYATRPADRSMEQWAYSSGAGTWSSASDRIGTIIIAESLEYFPEANSGAGGLVHYGGYSQSGDLTGGIRLSNSSVSSWAWVDDGFFPANGNRYHLNATYLPAQQVVLCGGGNAGSNCVALDAAGTVTARNSLPGFWGPGDNTDMGTVVSDRVTGRTFLVSANTNLLYEHNYAADTWPSLGALPSTGPRSFATMIPPYGVIMYVAGSSTGTPEIWLYKL